MAGRSRHEECLMLAPAVRLPPAGGDARSMLTVHQAKGAGYAMSQPEELDTALQVALQTGGILQLLLPSAWDYAQPAFCFCEAQCLRPL